MKLTKENWKEILKVSSYIAIIIVVFWMVIGMFLISYDIKNIKSRIKDLENPIFQDCRINLKGEPSLTTAGAVCRIEDKLYLFNNDIWQEVKENKVFL